MSDHIKRGAERHTDRTITYDTMDDDAINSVWCCTECGEPLEVRQRKSHAYVSLGCPCGAESLDLRMADLLEFKMEAWDTKVVHKLGRGGGNE